MVPKEQLLEQRLDGLDKKVDDGFERVDGRFTQVDKKIDDGFKQVDARFGRVETDVRELRGDIKALDQKLTAKIEKQGKELRSRFDQMTIRLVIVVVGTSIIDHLL